MGEGVPYLRDVAVDLLAAPVGAWDRFGTNGAIVNVDGRGDYLDLWLLELPPGGVSAPQNHLCEATVYVLSGQGSTVIETGGQTRTFEWGERSMFALPLNARYQFLNSSGSRPARLAMTTSFPIVMNLFRNADFIFGADFEFSDRLGAPQTFQGQGTATSHAHSDIQRDFWETSFVPDLGAFSKLKEMKYRGKGKAVRFLLADSILHAHLSEIPTGMYKKAHRHMGGSHIYPVTGLGYSLLWYEGDQERRRIDWSHGHVYSPPDNMYHQHFNVGTEPARYFAVKMGNYRYPVLSRMKGQFHAGVAEKKSTRSQIDYEDEDPAIRRLYVEELRKRGIDFALT